MPVQQAVFEPLLKLPDVMADGAWSPHIDVRELPDEYIVLADLPGVEAGAVHITTETNTLTIEGARRDRLRAGGVPYRLERPTGKLRRSVLLPGPTTPPESRRRSGTACSRSASPKNERSDRGEAQSRRANDKPSRRQRTQGSAEPPVPEPKIPLKPPKEGCGCEPD